MNHHTTVVSGRRCVLGIVFVLFALACSVDFAAGARESRPPEQPPGKKKDGGVDIDTAWGAEEAAKQAKKLAEKAGRRVESFAVYMDSKFAALSDRPSLQWGILLVALFGGLAFWLLGWALLKTFFVPVVVFAGCATGGFLGSLVPSAFSLDASRNLAMTVTVLGLVTGGAFYLLVGKKFKPLGMFLVVITPFAMMFSALLGYSYWIALVVLAVGGAFGFASMLYLRPVSIVATSLLGTFALMIGFRLLQPTAGLDFVGVGFRWLADHPSMLFLTVCVGILMGAHVQYTTGPGDIEVEEVKGMER